MYVFIQHPGRRFGGSDGVDGPEGRAVRGGRGGPAVAAVLPRDGATDGGRGPVGGVRGPAAAVPARPPRVRTRAPRPAEYAPGLGLRDLLLEPSSGGGGLVLCSCYAWVLFFFQQELKECHFWIPMSTRKSYIGASCDVFFTDFCGLKTWFLLCKKCSAFDLKIVQQFYE